MQWLSSYCSQDLNSTPPTISRSNRPIKYAIWCPNPRMGCQSPTLKVIHKTQACPMIVQPTMAQKKHFSKGSLYQSHDVKACAQKSRIFIGFPSRCLSVSCSIDLSNLSTLIIFSIITQEFSSLCFWNDGDGWPINSHRDDSRWATLIIFCWCHHWSKPFYY